MCGDMVYRVFPLWFNTFSLPAPLLRRVQAIDGSLYTTSLEEKAPWLWFWNWWWTQDCTDGFIEHCLKATLSQGWAFQIFHGTCRHRLESYRTVQKAARAQRFVSLFKGVVHGNVQHAVLCKSIHIPLTFSRYHVTTTKVNVFYWGFMG